MIACSAKSTLLAETESIQLFIPPNDLDEHLSQLDVTGLRGEGVAVWNLPILKLPDRLTFSK